MLVLQLNTYISSIVMVIRDSIAMTFVTNLSGDSHIKGDFSLAVTAYNNLISHFDAFQQVVFGL